MTLHALLTLLNSFANSNKFSFLLATLVLMLVLVVVYVSPPRNEYVVKIIFLIRECVTTASLRNCRVKY